jgi:DNA repair protein RadA
MVKKKKVEDSTEEQTTDDIEVTDDDTLTEDRVKDNESKESEEHPGEDDLTRIPGVGKASADKLRNAQYDSFMAIAVTSPKVLTEIDGISDEAAVKIVNGAKKLAKTGEFISTTELREKRKSLLKLTTSSPQLDNLFGGGGLSSTTITEFFGEFGSGKTQMCFQLAVNATMPVEKGGLNGHVLVIDTENTFRPMRIEQLAKAQGLDVNEVNEKIHVARAFNSAHQMLLLEEKAYEMAKKYPIKLVIVDSLTAHFRAEYIGRGALGERQGMLNKHMHALLRFADIYNAVIAVTNQVMSNPGQMFGDPTKPIGGNVVGHTSTYRIYMRKGAKGKKVARMIDSPENPDSEALLTIDECGVRDG